MPHTFIPNLNGKICHLSSVPFQVLAAAVQPATSEKETQKDEIRVDIVKRHEMREGVWGRSPQLISGEALFCEKKSLSTP